MSSRDGMPVIERDRYEVGLHEGQYVVMDRDALRIEDLIVESYQSRTAAQMTADHLNLVSHAR